MPTWRERNAAARENGGYTDQDKALIDSFHTCMVGEAIAMLGRDTKDVFRAALKGETPWYEKYRELDRLGNEAVLPVRYTPDPDKADRILDQIEDEVLRLKREGLV